MDFDAQVKLTIYGMIAETTRVPTAREVARGIGTPGDQVEVAFGHLYQKRLLVLEPGDASRIRMAPPFSGMETQHVTQIGAKRYFANCAWDAFGIAAALHSDADVFSTCGDCGEGMEFAIRGGRPVVDKAPDSDVPLAHFAVPAAKWWADIIHT